MKAGKAARIKIAGRTIVVDGFDRTELTNAFGDALHAQVPWAVRAGPAWITINPFAVETIEDGPF